MRKNAKLLHLDNFQTNIAGDAYLILGLTEQILHPIILIQFSAGPIALIKQKTPNNKVLIIGGTIKDWQNLQNSPIEINTYMPSNTSNLQIFNKIKIPQESLNLFNMMIQKAQGKH